MNKKELLVPAGDMESLKYAVYAGADAIYIGGKKFGARKFADNFDKEQLLDAVKFCHLYSVKLYITVNTIIYEDEIEECLKYIEYLGKIKVDALIVQDVGLIRLIKNKYPNIEIHASTQMHNYNEKQFKILKDLGVSRVVLAREMDIDSINNIKTDLEKEVFIHGAICISYSGQCLFSSLILNRSGNRGECAGMCRLPYDLINDKNEAMNNEERYLISPKELSSIDKIKEFMESDIKSFKIEGRMKSKEYVYLVTKIYRTLIDKYVNNEKLEIDEELYKNLKIIFNREFTNGHLFNNCGKDLMNIKSPNHIGIKIGAVIKVDKKKIWIKLCDTLYQEDGIRFDNDKGMIANFIYDEKDNLINNAKAGDIIYLDNKIGLNKTCYALKTSSNYLNKKISLIEPKKINIKYKVTAKLDNKLEIDISDYNNEIKVYGNKLEKSINKSTTIDDIKDKLLKLGDTPFICDNIEFNVDDNIFIPISIINNLRRDLVNKLIELRENNGNNLIINDSEIKSSIINKSDIIKLSCTVSNEEQFNICSNNINGDIYITDEKLYLKYKDLENVYYKVPRLNNKEIKYNNVMIPDLSNLYRVKDKNAISDYFLNVVNKSYIDYLFENNIKKVTLSVEIDPYKVKSILNRYDYLPNIEILIYGKVELMIMNHCIINNIVNKDNKLCNLCKNNNYYLLDRNNKKYKIETDCRSNKIINYTPNICSDEDIFKYIKMGIKNYRIDFTDESIDDIVKIIKKYKNILQIN